MSDRTAAPPRILMVLPSSGVQVIEDRLGGVRLRSNDGGLLEIEPEVAASLSAIASRSGADAAEEWLRSRLEMERQQASIYAEEVGRYYRCGKHLCVRPA